jgi:hypothetical protein
MELATTTYEVLGKNKDETIRIKLILDSIPEARWTVIFNNRANKIKSIKNTPTLILEDVAESIHQINIVKAVQDLIHLVNAEVESDNQKIMALDHYKIAVPNTNPQKYTTRLIGTVIARDSLPYDASIIDVNHPERIMNYSQFLSKINNNQIL